MRTLLLVLAACSSASDPESRALGMNDVTLLLPLPDRLDQPVLATIANDGAPLIAENLVAALVFAAEMGPKNGLAVSYADFQVVGLRFDLCPRARVGRCAAGEDGRLRLVLQPLYRQGDATLAHDIALHAFYPIPAGDLPAVVRELRAIAALRDLPVEAPLGPEPLVGAALDRMSALLARYAGADRLVRLTAAGQESASGAFAWLFHGFDIVDGRGVPIEIPEIARTRQQTLVAGGDTVYQVEPTVGHPLGLPIALSGVKFAAATADERRVALEALAEIENPRRHDAVDLQCIGCHVATYLTERRSQVAGVEPDSIAGRFTSRYDTRVDTIEGNLARTDGRSVRALGWATGQPAVSQRVANDTAQVLEEIDARFPHAGER